MRSKRRLAVAIASLAVTTGSVAAVSLPDTAAHAAGTVTSVTLPMDYFSDILVDPVHQHVFITGSGGVFSTNVAHLPASNMLVTDFSGQAMAKVPGALADSSMWLSPDDSTIYSAAGSYVDTVDTSTVTDITRYFVGSGVDVKSVVEYDGMIWFGYQANFPGTTGAIPAGIGMINPSVIPTSFPANGAGNVNGPGVSAATVTMNATNDPAGTWGVAPLLAVTSSGVLVAAGTQDPPTEEAQDQLATYDVSSGTAAAVMPPTQDATGVNLQDMRITPDDNDVVLASGAPYADQIFQISDLSLVGQYPAAESPSSVAITSNGTVFAGTTYNTGSIFAYAPGGSTPVNTITFSGSASVPTRDGVAVTSDGSYLFAITSPSGLVDLAAKPVLNIVPDPAQTSSTLSASAPATVRKDQAITVTGTLGGTSPYAGGQTLTVTRTDPSDPNGVALPDVTTNADGTFSFTDTPPKFNGDSGTVTYQVSSAGDAYLTASSTSASVTVTSNNS